MSGFVIFVTLSSLCFAAAVFIATYTCPFAPWNKSEEEKRDRQCSEAEAAMWQMIETSLLSQPRQWRMGLHGHVLYNETADFGVWISNDDFGLSAGFGENRSPRTAGAKPHEVPPEYWRKRLWKAAKPILEVRKIEEQIPYYEQVASAFERTVN